MRFSGLSLLLLGVSLGLADDQPATNAGFAERGEEHRGLVDEDEDFAQPERTYAFNPVQALNELKVGNFYAKKGSHKAAATRYLEATRWDAGLAEAFWRLGMTREKLDQPQEAIRAYAGYLRIEPQGKKARDVRRRLEKLEQLVERLPLAAQGSHAADSP